MNECVVDVEHAMAVCILRQVEFRHVDASERESRVDIEDHFVRDFFTDGDLRFLGASAHMRRQYRILASLQRALERVAGGSGLGRIHVERSAGQVAAAQCH